LQFHRPRHAAVAHRHAAPGGKIAILDVDQVDPRREGGDVGGVRRRARRPAVGDVDQRDDLLGQVVEVGEELRELGDRADVADRLVLQFDEDVVTGGEIAQPLDRRPQVARREARIAQVAEHAQARRFEHGGDIEGVRQGIVGRAFPGVEGEIDRAAAGLVPARRRPLQDWRDEGRYLEAGVVEPALDRVDLLERHAEQVAAVDGAHVEAAHAVLAAERDHLVERRADLVADHGQGEAGYGHGVSLAKPGSRRLSRQTHAGTRGAGPPAARGRRDRGRCQAAAAAGIGALLPRRRLGQASTIRVPPISSWPSPQNTSQKKAYWPGFSGVMVTRVSWSGMMSVRMPNSGILKPWIRSSEVSTKVSGWPTFAFTVSGWNSNLLAAMITSTPAGSAAHRRQPPAILPPAALPSSSAVNALRFMGPALGLGDRQLGDVDLAAGHG